MRRSLPTTVKVQLDNLFFRSAAGQYINQVHFGTVLDFIFYCLTLVCQELP